MIRFSLLLSLSMALAQASPLTDQAEIKDDQTISAENRIVEPMVEDPVCTDTPAAMEVCLRTLQAATPGPTAECKPKPKPPGPTAQERCLKKQKNFFADGTVNITYAGGYFDSGDNVISEAWMNKIIERLTGKCPTSFQVGSRRDYMGKDSDVLKLKADQVNGVCGKPQPLEQSCGFKRTDDPEILLKTIVVGKRVIPVKIRMVQPAISGNDRKNRASSEQLILNSVCAQASLAAKKSPHDKERQRKVVECVKVNTPPMTELEKFQPYCKRGDEHRNQICRSLYVKKVWTDSIARGDEFVAYDGHARNGGGPSFEPPRRLADGHTDYDWYERHRPGHRAEVAVLKAATKKGKPPVLYSSLSCNSHRHFMKRGHLQSAAPDTAFVLSKRTVYADETVAAFLSSIDGMLGQKCQPKLGKSVEGGSCGFKVYNF